MKRIPTAQLKERGRQYGIPTFYWVMTTLLRGVLWTIGRWQVRGRRNVPREGAIIVVSNHLNLADPPILAAGIARRRVRFLAKHELFRLPFGLVVRPYGAIPIRRFDADAGALITSMRVLRDGHALGMFPEGTRSRDLVLGEMHPGTAALALRTGTAILPCAITGTEQIRSPRVLFIRPKVTVSIGRPIPVEQKRRPSDAEIAELMEQVRSAIAAQLPARYREP